MLIAIASGIIGGGVSSQVNAINKSYREVLLKNRDYIERRIDEEYGGKITRKMKSIYSRLKRKQISDEQKALQGAYEQADKLLEEYDKLPSSKKNLEALKDVSN